MTRTTPRFTHTIEVYRDAGGEWRWRAVARNGRTVADSGEGYKRRGDAVTAVQRLLGGTHAWWLVGETANATVLRGRHLAPGKHPARKTPTRSRGND